MRTLSINGYMRLSINKLFAVFLFMVSYSNTFSQGVRINEIMSSNGNIIQDIDGDYSDWIELFNSTSDPISLEGYFLSDDAEVLEKWQFPSVTVGPKGFLLIWASGKDMVKNGEIHTNFSIAASGEALFLSNSQPSLLDETPVIEIPRNYSFGSVEDGGDEFTLFSVPTPNATNSAGEISQENTKPIVPSVIPGFYSSNISVAFETQDPATKIYYTINSSNPDTNSQQYFGPITVADRTSQNNIFSMIPTTNHGGARGYREPNGNVSKGTIIRTLAITEGKEPIEQSFSYFVFPQGQNKYSLPVFSIVTDQKNFFSDEIGLFVPGSTYDTSAPNPYFTGNYFQRGIEWERPANISFFGKEGGLSFQENVGIRIHGGITRHFPQKAMRIYFRAEYGNNALDYKLFDERNYTGIRRFLLRTSGNDFGETYFRDAFAQRLGRHLDVDYQAYEPSIVFINGEYWGIHNIRERQDNHYLNNLYGVDPDNVDLLTGPGEVEEGDNQQFNYIRNLLETLDPNDENSIVEIEKYIDLSNHMDYMISQIYVANTDWPHNNIDYWRERVDYNPNSPKGRDGKFRWILYDTDFGLSHVNTATHNTLAWVANKQGQDNQEWPNFIFRSLLAHETYKNKFINRFLDNLNTTFDPARANLLLEETKQRLDPEIQEHLDRWIEPGSKSNWENKVGEIAKFQNERPANLISHLKSQFNISDDFTINLGVSIPNAGRIKINSLEITNQTPGVGLVPYPWQGKYFAGVPIKLSPKPHDGYLFDHWLVNGSKIAEKEISLTLDKNTDVTAVFVENPVAERRVLYYWFFGTNLENDVALTEISSTYSLTGIPGNLSFIPAISPYPGEGTGGIMDRVNDPTEINFRQNVLEDLGLSFADMRGLRVRNPLQVDNNLGHLIIDVPMNIYEKPKFSAAVSRTNNGPESISLSYRTSVNGTWTTDGLSDYSFELDTDFSLLEVEFDEVEEAKNNANFQIKIDFEGNTTANSGNARFNNMTLEAIPLRGNDLITSLPNLPKEKTLPILTKIYPNPFSEKLFLMINEQELNNISSIQILDSRGVDVLRLENVPQAIEELDMSHVNSGFYIVKVVTKTNLEIHKIVKK